MFFAWNDVLGSSTVSSAPQAYIYLSSVDISYSIYVCIKYREIVLFLSRNRATYLFFSMLVS